MLNAIITSTIKGIYRDRVFHAIIATSVLFIFIPSISGISMRIMTELSLNLCLSLTSFILLLFSLLLGGTAIWKDIDRRYSYSVLSLPISREKYILGKYFGIALFFLFTVAFFNLVTIGVVQYSSAIYPPNRPVNLAYVSISFFFELLKYLLLVSIAFLFSSVSTSFFLPLFGTISLFFVGTASQQVYDYVMLEGGTAVSPMVAAAAKALYYIIPNFSAFDYKASAIYAVPPSITMLSFTALYALVYIFITLSLTILIYRKREMN